MQSKEQQRQVYTERGKWRVAYPKEIDYVVKGFVPKESVVPLHRHFPDRAAHLSKEMQSVTEGGIPRSAGGHLLRMVTDFKEKVDDFYRLNNSPLDRIHDIVADENERLEYTLEELATKALGIERNELDEVILYAVHRAIRRNTFFIENDKSSPFTNHYLVQPKRVAEITRTVNKWVHDYQEYLVQDKAGENTVRFNDHPLQQFLQKARRLIDLSRTVRSPTTMSCIGPTAHRYQPGDDGIPTVYREVATEKFNEDDKKIIEYLQLYCIPPRQMTSGVLRSAGSYIMQATGKYSSMALNASTMPLFLQELGVISPWENLRLLDQSLSLPGHGVSARSDAAWEDVLRASEQLSSDGITDSMQDMRTDWGDLPIYCVDSPEAEEIDDGVSLERIPGSDDTFWVRIHIANPSAFIPPDHVVVQNAASRYQTLYVPERTYPMLPSSLTQAHFSLSPGRPTLTFSAKMNLDGEVLETNITNGTAQNVIYITHDTLRSVLEPDAEGRSREILRVGGDFTRDHSRKGLRDTLSKEEKDTFHTLRKLMRGFRKWRLKDGALEFPGFPETAVSVHSGNAAMKSYDMTDIDQGRYILGDPIIQLESRDFDPHEIPDLTKRNLIAPLMNLACWVSGRWCAERNIPAVYDGTWDHPEYPRHTNDTISQRDGSTWSKHALPKGVSSSEPIHHVSLGLDKYIKSTSPLRRYIDLLAHYQIEAALRFESKNGRPLKASNENETETDMSFLPFSKEDVDTYITRSRWKRSRLRECDSASKQFWACLLFFRAFYFQECDLPATFTCHLHTPYKETAMAGTEFHEGYRSVMTAFGVKCHVRVPEEWNVGMFSVVEGRITEVNLSRMLVVLEATRLVKRVEKVEGK